MKSTKQTQNRPFFFFFLRSQLWEVCGQNPLLLPRLLPPSLPHSAERGSLKMTAKGRRAWSSGGRVDFPITERLAVQIPPNIFFQSVAVSLSKTLDTCCLVRRGRLVQVASVALPQTQLPTTVSIWYE